MSFKTNVSSIESKRRYLFPSDHLVTRNSSKLTDHYYKAEVRSFIVNWIVQKNTDLLKKMLFLIVGLISVSQHCYGYETFQNLIPNGDKVPHPCGNNQIWDGVGHLNPAGSGARNQFGLDFINAGKRWTKDLCNKDSDFDGKTNGVELGDPKCLWNPGDIPTSPPSSHPGICEPLNSSTCQHHNKDLQQYLICENQLKQKPCPALSDPDVKNLTMRFPKSKIDPIVTNYMCMVYDLPSEGDFHLVATTPNVDNAGIVHHMILFGCDFPDDYNKTLVNMMKAMPYGCGMTPHKHCQQFLATWTYGFDGECLTPDTGFRIGQLGTKVAALQVHWHNPEQLDDQTDSSGMTIYYTPAEKRTFDASTFIIGQEYLLIPPNQTSTTFKAQCPSECTNEMWDEKIYVTRAVNHMHYYGKSQRISIYRKGKWIRDLTNEINYNYDAPRFNHFDPPVEVYPGDDIVTECSYGSDKDLTVTFGAGTHNEMCYGFITYYPVQNFLPTICIQWKSVQRCVRKLPKFNGLYNGCDWRNFADWLPNSPTTKAFNNTSCGAYRKTQQCNKQCIKDSKELLKHQCLKGDLGEWLEAIAGIPIDILRTCASNTNSANSIRNFSVNHIYYIVMYFSTIILTKL
ncbi:DBH-like monooxygenase protein 1 [Mactra antiquata]